MFPATTQASFPSGSRCYLRSKLALAKNNKQIWLTGNELDTEGLPEGTNRRRRRALALFFIAKRALIANYRTWVRKRDALWRFVCTGTKTGKSFEQLCFFFRWGHFPTLFRTCQSISCWQMIWECWWVRNLGGFAPFVINCAREVLKANTSRSVISQLKCLSLGSG